MRWRLVVALAGFGLLMGLGSLLGLTRGVEPLLWLAIGIICAFVMALRLDGHYFVHGFTVSLVAAIVHGLVQFVSFDQYLAHNPEFAADLQQPGMPVDPRLFVLLVAPVIGVLSGIALGLMTALLAAVRRRLVRSSA